MVRVTDRAQNDLKCVEGPKQKSKDVSGGYLARVSSYREDGIVHVFCSRYSQSSKGHTCISKHIYPRVIVLAICTSSNVG